MPLLFAPVPGTPVGPARHGALIMNLRSGGGKAQRFDLAGECRKRGIEAIMLEPGKDLLELAQDAIARGADVIGMAGGDGSQALVASVAMGSGVPLVCVPAGTRNHFALDLGLDRDDVVGALDAFGDAVERRIDLAEVGGRVFVNNVSLGVYAKIVQAPDYRDAKRQTALDLLPELPGPGAEPFDLRFTGPDGSERTGAQIIQVSNNPYVLTRLGGFGTRARLDTGMLGVAAAEVRGPRRYRRVGHGRDDRPGGPLSRLDRVDDADLHRCIGLEGGGGRRRRGAAAGPAARVQEPARSAACALAVGLVDSDGAPVYRPWSLGAHRREETLDESLLAWRVRRRHGFVGRVVEESGSNVASRPSRAWAPWLAIATVLESATRAGSAQWPCRAGMADRWRRGVTAPPWAT